MKNPHRHKWLLWVLSLLLFKLLLSGNVWGQAAPVKPETAPAEEEAVEKPPVKPPPKPPSEAPPELTPEKPGYFPGIAATPETTLEVGPITGIMAPFGNPLAMDTLIRGWHTHRLGPLGLSTYLEYDALYRTNIFQTSTEKKADFINSFNPGIRMELPLAGRHKISLGYLGNYFLFTKNDTENHYDHNVNVDAAFNFPGGLSLRFGNTYRAATEERTAVTGRQRDYERLTPYFLGTYRLSERWKVQVTYQFDNLLFLQPIDQSDEYREHIAGMTLYYKFWPKTALMAQYLFTAREYPFSPQGDNTAKSGFVGLTWDPTAKFTGLVKFGYSQKSYDNELPGRSNSPSSWAMSLQTLYRYSRYTQFSLTGQRSIQEDLDFGNNAYENTAIFLSVNHEWPYFRLTSYLALSYSLNDYINAVVDPVTGDSKKRSDRNISLGGGLSRPFTKWLRLRLDYNYTNRSSNFSGFSYNDHRILAGVQGSF
jgi:hypothetical protein